MNDGNHRSDTADIKFGGTVAGPVPGGGQLARRPVVGISAAPVTITDGLESLLAKQEEIKAALDVLIADATTLRAQM